MNTQNDIKSNTSNEISELRTKLEEILMAALPRELQPLIYDHLALVMFERVAEKSPKLAEFAKQLGNEYSAERLKILKYDATALLYTAWDAAVLLEKDRADFLRASIALYEFKMVS